jgi:hypothetical protein
MLFVLKVFGSIHTEHVTARHASRQIFFKWYSYITTVHTEGVMARLYIVYYLDMTRDVFSVNGPFLGLFVFQINNLKVAYTILNVNCC